MKINDSNPGSQTLNTSRRAGSRRGSYPAAESRPMMADRQPGAKRNPGPTPPFACAGLSGSCEMNLIRSAWKKGIVAHAIK